MHFLPESMQKQVTLGRAIYARNKMQQAAGLHHSHNNYINALTSLENMPFCFNLLVKIIICMGLNQ
jgi:hypothetical protein